MKNILYEVIVQVFYTMYGRELPMSQYHLYFEHRKEAFDYLKEMEDERVEGDTTVTTINLLTW